MGNANGSSLEVGDVDEVGFVFMGHRNTSVAITASDGVATVTNASHGYKTGDEVVISGATEDDFNGAHDITVTGDDTYTYPTTAADGPATGAPLEKSPLILITPTACTIQIGRGDGTETSLDETAPEVRLGAILGKTLREKLADNSDGAYTADDLATGAGVVGLEQEYTTDGRWRYACIATAGVRGTVNRTVRVRPALPTN